MVAGTYYLLQAMIVLELDDVDYVANRGNDSSSNGITNTSCLRRVAYRTGNNVLGHG